VDIGGRSICSSCKPAVLQVLQQSGEVIGLGDSARNEPAWERRQELGIFPSAWQSLQDVLVKPVETFSAMRREGGLMSPYTYALLLGSIGGIANALYQLVTHTFTNSLRQPLPPNFPPEFERYMEMLQSPLFIIGYAIVIPIVITMSTFIGAGILHLCLMLCGGANRPFETTYRVYCYSYGSTMALQVIPFCGAGVAGIWNLVCNCIGLAKAHETDTWRAVVAVLLPIIVCCAGFFAIFVSAIAFAANASH
jgi:hypothetical protein